MIVYGKQVFLYILEKHFNKIQKIYLSKDIDKKLFSKIARLNKPIIKIDNKKAQAMSKNGNHQGFFVEIDEFKYVNLNEIINKDFLLILDNITDVGNIGNIVRTAYSLGVNAIIVTGIKDIKIQNIIRTSSGAGLDLPIVNFFDIKDLINRLKQNDFRLIGASLDGISLKEFKKDNKKIGLVVGSENSGVTKSIKKNLQMYKIDMKNGFDSLNVSVATAIFIYELGK